MVVESAITLGQLISQECDEREGCKQNYQRRCQNYGSNKRILIKRKNTDTQEAVGIEVEILSVVKVGLI